MYPFSGVTTGAPTRNYTSARPRSKSSVLTTIHTYTKSSIEANIHATCRLLHLHRPPSHQPLWKCHRQHHPCWTASIWPKLPFPPRFASLITQWWILMQCLIMEAAVTVVWISSSPLRTISGNSATSLPRNSFNQLFFPPVLFLLFYICFIRLLLLTQRVSFQTFAFSNSLAGKCLVSFAFV